MRKSLLLILCLFFGLLKLADALEKAPGSSGASELQTPPGVRVAIIVFEDLQCGACASAYRDLEKAARSYHIPLVHVEYPLPAHPWAQQAAILARFFDSRSAVLGRQFREFIFSEQSRIGTNSLRSFAERFAAAHNIQLPFVLDPEKRFEQAVQKDVALGQKMGVQQTPAVFVVQRGGKAPIEVNDEQALEKLLSKLKNGRN